MAIDNIKGMGVARAVKEKTAVKKSKQSTSKGFVSNVPTSGGGGDGVENIDDASGYVGTSGGVAGLDALIAVQEVSFQDEGYRNDMTWGKNMLFCLEELRNSLLEGAVSTKDLEHIVKRVEEHKSEEQKRGYAEKQLNDVLDEIELRASVELAKLGREV